MKLSAVIFVVLFCLLSSSLQASTFARPMALNFYGYTTDSDGQKIGEFAVSCSNGLEVNLAKRKAAGEWCYGTTNGSSTGVMCVSKKIKAAQEACRQPAGAQLQMADITKLQ